MSHHETFGGDERLSGCTEVTVGVALPAPLSERLDELVRLAEETGERTTRKELVASLVLAAPMDGAVLSDGIRRLRHAAVSDAVVPDASGRVRLKPRGPGPRSRTR